MDGILYREMDKHQRNFQEKPKLAHNMEDRAKFITLPGRQIGVFCEICLEFNGERKDVYGFCTNCKEYLCKTCCDYHCRPKPSRDHRLVYKADMPELDEAVKTQSLSGYHCPKMCETHPDMPVFLKCNIHNKQICTLCASIMHMSCKTEAIQTTETLFLSQLKLERTFKEIDEVVQGCNKNKETARLNLAKNEQQKCEAIEGVEKLTEILHKELDFALKKFILLIKECHKENKTMIDSVKESNEKASHKALKLKKQLQTFVEQQRYSHLYCGVQNSAEIISSLQKVTKSVDVESKYKEIICKVDKRLHDLIENPDFFVLVTGQNDAMNFPMYKDLPVLPDSGYVEARIPDKDNEDVPGKRNNTGAYDYVYAFLSPQRKS